MVAVFHPQPAQLAPAPTRRARDRHTPVRGDRPDLRVIPGGRDDASAMIDAETRQVLRLLVAISMALILAFLGLRALRANGWAAADTAAANVAEASVPAAVPAAGEAVYVVQPGDSLWSIASQLAPGDDPRPLVDELARRNGGTIIAAGQRLVLPTDQR